MKHSLPVTLLLVAVFIASQLIGLGLIAASAKPALSEDGICKVTYDDTAIGARPETTGAGSFIYIIVGVAVGTIVLLILAKYRMTNVWRLWFFAAVCLAITVSIGAFLPFWAALVLAFILAAWKIFKPNIIVHNVTEVLVYSGIALLVAPLFDILYISLLLIVIAIYDAYAVWHSKHMVSMAKFQTEAKLFAGLFIPYERKAVTMGGKPTLGVKPVQKPEEGRSAILGGGDIAFPMLFCGVVFTTLLNGCMTKVGAYVETLIVVFCATIALLLLFLYAKQDKFYPAMPFLGAGCFVGYGIVWLLHAF